MYLVCLVIILSDFNYLQPESSEGTDSTYLEQKERLLSLFKRQLTVPLLGKNLLKY